MLRIIGTYEEIENFKSQYNISYLYNAKIEIITNGYITDDEIDLYGRFTDEQKQRIKDMYYVHEKGFYKNPEEALR